MFTRLLLVLPLSAAFLLQQEKPSPCCAPGTEAGRIFSVGLTVHRMANATGTVQGNTVYESTTSFIRDVTSQRAVYDTSMSTADQTANKTMRTISVIHYAANDFWTLVQDENGEQCYHTKLPGVRLQRYCLDNVEFVDTLNYGVPPNIIRTHLWAGSNMQPMGGVQVITEDKTCAVLGYAKLDEKGPDVNFHYNHFVNIEPQVPDYNLLNMPSSCSNSTEIPFSSIGLSALELSGKVLG